MFFLEEMHRHTNDKPVAVLAQCIVLHGPTLFQHNHSLDVGELVVRFEVEEEIPAQPTPSFGAHCKDRGDGLAKKASSFPRERSKRYKESGSFRFQWEDLLFLVQIYIACQFTIELLTISVTGLSLSLVCLFRRG